MQLYFLQEQRNGPGIKQILLDHQRPTKVVALIQSLRQLSSDRSAALVNGAAFRLPSSNKMLK